MKELGDRHIKTPLNCEIEHSVKIDLTFTAYRSLPRAVPKFLDNCFIIGFTYFPVAVLTSSEEGVISKSPWQLKEASLLLRERLALECSCQLLHKQKSVLWKWGMIFFFCAGCWDDRHPRMQGRTLPGSQGVWRRAGCFCAALDNAIVGYTSFVALFRQQGTERTALPWDGA